jgi:hypothetical protein
MLPLLLAVSASLSLVRAAPQLPTYRVTEIPFVATGGSVEPVTLTDDGQVAFSSGGHAYVWSSASGLRELFAVPGASIAHVADLRPNGEAVGNCVPPPGVWARAMAWSSAGTPRELRTPSWAIATRARASNGRAQYVGDSFESNGVSKPLLWWQDVVSTLPLPVGITEGSAYDVNNRGVIVGYGKDPSSPQPLPVVWNSPTHSVLPVLPSSAVGGILMAVNDADEAVGEAWTDTAPGVRQALRYDSTGLRLLAGPAGRDVVRLLSLNRDGVAVGQAVVSAGSQSDGIIAFGDSIEVIDDLLDPSASAVWHVIHLASINNHGQIAARGVRTTPPFDAILLLDPMP